MLKFNIPVCSAGLRRYFVNSFNFKLLLLAGLLAPCSIAHSETNRNPDFDAIATPCPDYYCGGTMCGTGQEGLDWGNCGEGSTCVPYPGGGSVCSSDASTSSSSSSVSSSESSSSSSASSASSDSSISSSSDSSGSFASSIESSISSSSSSSSDGSSSISSSSASSQSSSSSSSQSSDGCTPILGAPECSNCLDDDGDGLIDYPSDPECDSPNDNDEDNQSSSTSSSSESSASSSSVSDSSQSSSSNSSSYSSSQSSQSSSTSGSSGSSAGSDGSGSSGSGGSSDGSSTSSSGSSGSSAGDGSSSNGSDGNGSSNGSDGSSSSTDGSSGSSNGNNSSSGNSQSDGGSNSSVSGDGDPDYPPLPPGCERQILIDDKENLILGPRRLKTFAVKSLKKLRKAARTRQLKQSMLDSERRTVKKLNKFIILSEAALAQLPGVQVVCSSEEFCVAVDNTAAINQHTDAIRRLWNQIIRTLGRATRTVYFPLSEARKHSKPLQRRVKKEARELLKIAEKFPKKANSCT